MFQNKVVVITGGAAGIGKCMAEEFRKAGATVCVIDKAEGDHYVGDISKKEVLEAFATDVIARHGKIDVLVNNALPIMRGIDACSYEEFQYALAVGVTVSVIACIPMRYMKKPIHMALGMVFLAVYYGAVAVGLLTTAGTQDPGLALYVVSLFCLPCVIPGNIFAWAMWWRFRGDEEDEE